MTNAATTRVASSPGPVRQVTAPSTSLMKACNSKTSPGLMHQNYQRYCSSASKVEKANFGIRLLKNYQRHYSPSLNEEKDNFVIRLVKELFTHNEEILSKYWAQLDGSV